MYDTLRYCVRKQQILRYALVETLERRNKKRARVFIDLWRQRTHDSIKCTLLLEKKMKLTVLRRVYRQIGKV